MSQCILVTFTLSVCLIWLWDEKPGFRFYTALAAVFILCRVVPDLLPNTDFRIDYGVWGVLLPWMVYVASTRGLTVGLLLLAFSYGGNQWWALAAVPLLMLYNGQRGKWKIGKLFYFYYPAHLVIIYLLILLLP